MSGTARKIGLIRKFLQIDNSIFCIIQRLEKSKNLIENTIENFPVNTCLDRFFLICKLLHTYDIIKLNAIVAKCVLLINEDDYFIRIFNDFHANMD